MKQDSKYRIILLLSNFLFIGLYLFLTFSNRYAADDHWFVFNARLRGVIGAAQFVYETWTPRPTEILLLNTLSVFFSEKTVLILFGLIVLFLLVWVVERYFRLIVRSLRFSISGFELLSYSVSFVTLFFFSCFSIGETWFWLCSSMGYLLGLAMALWGLYLMISNSGSMWKFVVTVVCWLYVFGSAELFAASCVALIFLYLLLMLVIHKGETINDRLFKQLLLIGLIGLGAVCFTYAGVGTQYRQSLLPETSFLYKIRVEIVSVGILFIKKIPAGLPYMIIMAFPFILLGSKMSVFPFGFKKTIVWSSALLVSIIVITLIPSSFVMSELPPDRALTFISFLFAIYLALLFFLLGCKIAANTFIQKARFVFPLFTLLFLAYTSYDQFTVVSKYSVAVNEREKMVLDAKQNRFSGVLTVAQLPPSGMLYPDELSADTADHRNRFYKMYYSLNFGVSADPNK